MKDTYYAKDDDKGPRKPKPPASEMDFANESYCRTGRQSCNIAPCCNGLSCRPFGSFGSRRCCVPAQQRCSSSTDCCSGLTCNYVGSGSFQCGTLETAES